MATLGAIQADSVLPFQTSPSGLSQSTFADMIDVDTTPPTSSSGLSSQELAPHTSEPHALTKPLGGVPADAYPQNTAALPSTSAGLNNGVATRPASRSPSKSSVENVVVQGQKRTASGEVKPPIHAVGSGNEGYKTHSRTRSTASNGNRIAELSSQLRARLSYAASIVEKSWQSRDADGTEGPCTRHSQSPARSMSPLHDLRHIYLSPRNEAARSELQYLNRSPERRSASDFTSPRNSRLYNGPARISPTTSADIVSLARSSSRAGQNSLISTEILNPNEHQRRRLAPPADIVAGDNSRARRRPNPNTSVQSIWPNIPSRHRHSLSQPGSYQTLSRHSITSVPGTPPPTHSSQPQSNLQYSTPVAAASAKGRTPSQNAIMEQDAIETLLFMSSPGNSGYHANTNSQQSQQQRQSQQKQDHNTSSQTSTSSMSAPRTNLDGRVGLGIAGAPSLDPHKRPTQPQTQGQRPVRRVSFLDSNGNDGTSAAPSHSSIDIHPGQGQRGFRFEDQAGDEIDRMLDQMVDEDSDGDDNFIRNSQAWIQSGRGGASRINGNTG